MADNNKRSVQESLAEWGKTLGSILAAIFVATDARVRPMVADAIKLSASFGTRGGRLVRQLVDRHMVAYLLRPLLIMSTVAVTLAYGFGIYFIVKLDVGQIFADEAGWWLGGVALVATVFPIVLIGLVWFVVGLRDDRIRAIQSRLARGPLADALFGTAQQPGPMSLLRDEIHVAAQQVAALLQQALPPAVQQAWLATQSQMVELEEILREAEHAARGGVISEVEVSLRRMDARIGQILADAVTEIRAVRNNQPLLQSLQMRQQGLLNLRQRILASIQPLDGVRAQVRPLLERAIRNNFGRPGYAPHIAVTLIGQWLIAGLWYVAIGITLDTWYPHVIETTGHDPRVTSAFIVVGAIALAGAFVWYLFLNALVKGGLRYGVGFMRWAARLVLQPTVEIFDPTRDEQQIKEVIPDDLGIPIEEWYVKLATAHDFPVGVAAGVLMLLFTQHTLTAAGYIVADGFVLLAGYLFIVKMTGIRNKRIFNGIVIAHFVLGLILFTLWLFGPMISWSWFVGAGALALIVPFLVSKLFIAGLIAVAVLTGWLSGRTDGKRATFLFAVAVLFGVLGGGAALVRAAIPGGSTAVSAAISEAERAASADDGASPPESSTSMRQTRVAGSHPPPGRTCSRSPGASNPCP